MNTITGMLEGFEKIAYKFLLSVILIPKTIFQIIINPGWAPDYIKGEFKQEKNPFNEYLSPIMLLLVVAFLPAVIYGLLPPLGAAITHGPAEKEVVEGMLKNMIATDPSLADPSLRDPLESFLTNRFIKFEATTTSKSGPNGMTYLHSWYVEKITGQGEIPYTEIFRVNYASEDYPVEYLNNNTTKDSFYYLFDEPGAYYVNVDVEKYYGDSKVPLESFISYSSVYVPDEADKAIEVFNYSGSVGSSKQNKVSFSERLKNESNVFLALGLLMPPLLFALAIKLFKENEEISENSLRETFYAQCYYFSPLALTIWAYIYSAYYLTPEVFFYDGFYRGINMGSSIIFLPFILAMIWFIGVETDAIAREREIPRWAAFLITLFDVALIIAIAFLVLSFSVIQDPLRFAGIWLYLLGTAVLLAAVIISWAKRKKTENSKIRPSEVALASVLLLIFGLVGAAFAVGDKIPPSDPKPEITPTLSSSSEVVSAATEPPTALPPTDAPLSETQPYYTEEFDNPLSSDWSVFTVADSDQAHVDKVTVEAHDGKLVWNFDSVYVYYYLFNGAFRYDDVRVDVRADNRGRNNNNISLICRYDPDVGWYEFNIANNGLYDIYYAEVASNGKIVYNSITNGGSNSIKIGKEVNEYSITCKGEQLTLFINGDEVNSVAEKNYGLREGQVGVSVSSFDVLPILIEMDWIKISEP